MLSWRSLRRGRVGHKQRPPEELPPRGRARFSSVRRCAWSWMTDSTSLAQDAAGRVGAPGHRPRTGRLHEPRVLRGPLRRHGGPRRRCGARADRGPPASRSRQGAAAPEEIHHQQESRPLVGEAWRAADPEPQEALYRAPTECPICFEGDVEMDGPANSSHLTGTSYGRAGSCFVHSATSRFRNGRGETLLGQPGHGRR